MRARERYPTFVEGVFFDSATVSSEGILAIPADVVKDNKLVYVDVELEALVAFGIEFAVRQCTELLEAGVPGLHIYTMDRSKSTVGVVNRLRNQGLL